MPDQLAESFFPVSADSFYKGIIRTVLQQGQESAPRGMPTKELIHRSFMLPDASYNIVASPARKLNYRFSVAEWLWIMLGRNDVWSVSAFNRRIADFSDDGKTFYGAYGPRLVPQLEYVHNTLKADPDSRQAVATIWTPKPPRTKDVPCTVAFQFLLRGGRLHAHTFMRSNDAWLGLPYDLFNFTQVQAYVAGLLGVPVGQYTHTVGSLHLYERDWEAAERVATEPTFLPDYALRSPALVPIPASLEVAFELAASGGIAHAATFPEPWAMYVDLLRSKETGNAEDIRGPYKTAYALRNNEHHGS